MFVILYDICANGFAGARLVILVLKIEGRYKRERRMEGRGKREHSYRIVHRMGKVSRTSMVDLLI